MNSTHLRLVSTADTIITVKFAVITSSRISCTSSIRREDGKSSPPQSFLGFPAFTGMRRHNDGQLVKSKYSVLLHPVGHSLPQNNATQLRLLSHKPQGADKQAIHFEPKLPSSFLIPRLNIPQYLNLLPCGKRGGSCNSVLLNGGSQFF